MKRLLRRSAFSVIATVLLLYVADYLSLRFQFPGNRAQFGSVHVQPYVAVPQKNGKTEFILDAPIEQACVNALFPHSGLEPCWYLRRHAESRTNL